MKVVVGMFLTDLFFMRKVLVKNFFNRSTLAVARDMLGKYLVRRVGGREVSAMITEVEAYDGPRDRASHAHRGETLRNAPMFAAAGRWYIYLCYGMHWMLNAVTGPSGFPAAVLIRGVVGQAGPARLTKMLRVDCRLNDKIITRSSGLWIEDRGVRPNDLEIQRLPRIGVDYAGAWSKKPYRFVYRPR